MLRAALVATGILASAVPALADFEPYPGAQPDPELQKAVEEASTDFGVPVEGEMELFVSADPFEDVLAFYRKLGQEYFLPAIPGLLRDGYERDLPAEMRFGANGIETVPSGIRVKQAYVVLDGPPDIADAREWVAITRPLILEWDTDGTRFTYGEVRDATAIVRVRKP